jgi:hypothetical protein
VTDHVAPEQPEPEQVNTCVAVEYKVADEGETVSANVDVSAPKDRNSTLVSNIYVSFGKARVR